jgi:hypothetical protein
VGVGAEDRGDCRIANRAQNGIDVPGAVGVGIERGGRVADALAAAGRAWIDDRDVAAIADNPGLGTGKGIGRRIGGEHAAHQWFMLLAFTGVDAVGPRLVFAHETHVALAGGKGKGAR